MKYRTIKSIGENISMLGYGCMRFPTLPDGNIDEEKSFELIDTAIANGVNYFDTAYPYHEGRSESFVGKALAKYPRESYYLATKAPMWSINSLEDAKRIFAEQLLRTRTDYFDFYMLHCMNKEFFGKTVKLGLIDWLKEMKAEGKIRFFGFSFHDSYKVFEEMINYTDWDFCQLQLNYKDADEQAGLKGYELAKKKGTAVIIMEPVKGGLLANLPEDVTVPFKELNDKVSTASWSFRWCGSLDNVMVTLSGMTTMEQLIDNIDTYANFEPLTETEYKAFDKVLENIQSRIMNGCTACRYCMPCPAGVDIPHNFAIWNKLHMYGNTGSSKWDWSQTSKEKRADCCVQCGKCEEVCPQHINIRDDLMLVAKEFNQL